MKFVVHFPLVIGTFSKKMREPCIDKKFSRAHFDFCFSNPPREKIVIVSRKRGLLLSEISSILKSKISRVRLLSGRISGRAAQTRDSYAREMWLKSPPRT